MSFNPQDPNPNDPGVAPQYPGSTATGPYIPGQPGTPQHDFAPGSFGPPQYAVQQNKPGRQGLAVASLVLGIVAAVLCLIPLVGMVAFFLTPVGFILGAIAWRGASKGQREGKGKAIAGVVLAVLAFFGAILSTVVLASAVDQVGNDLDRALGNSTEQVLAKDLGVKIGNYTTESAGSGIRDGSLAVTLTNKSGEAQSFDVKIEALTASGTRIATDFAMVSDLGAGQSDEVEMFELSSEKDAAQLENATFKVIEASAY